MRLLLVSALAFLCAACDSGVGPESPPPPSDVELLLRPADVSLFVSETQSLPLDAVARSRSGAPVTFSVTGGGQAVQAEIASRSLEIRALRPGRETLRLRIAARDTLDLFFNVAVQEGAVRPTRALADTTLYARRDTLAFDLSQYFEHRDGGALQFQASSTSGRVEARVVGSVLRITALDDAQATVSVLVRGDASPPVAASFAVRARADWCAASVAAAYFPVTVGEKQRYQVRKTARYQLGYGIATTTLNGDAVWTIAEGACRLGNMTVQIEESFTATLDSTIANYLDQTRPSQITFPPKTASTTRTLSFMLDATLPLALGQVYDLSGLVGPPLDFPDTDQETVEISRQGGGFGSTFRVALTLQKGVGIVRFERTHSWRDTGSGQFSEGHSAVRIQ